jgi:predicted anti-sigma-YlaC factor YlaD
MFSCGRIRKKFYEYLEGNLVITEKVKIETHLKKCTSCSKELLKTKKLFELLPREENPQPSEEFWMHFDTELKSKISSVTGLQPKRYVLKSVKSVFPALNLRPAFSFALALAFLLVVGLTMGRFRSERIKLAQSERQLSEEELLLEELYLLDELSPDDIEDLEIEDLTDEELESDLPFLYKLDPALLVGLSETG